MATARIRLVARLGGTGSNLSPFVVGSLAVHGVFVAAMVLLPSLRPRKPFPDQPIVVDLVAVPRAAPRAQVAAPPAPTPPAAAAQLEDRLPERVKPLPESREAPARKQQPAPPTPNTRPPAEATDPAPGEAPGVGGEVGGGIVTPFDVGDTRFAWYRDSVTAALIAQWRRPILSGRVEPVEVRITFEILRDGQVRDLRVDRSSGVAVFDRAALRAVSDASPLPPLPGNWREPTLPATWVFRMVPE